MLRKILSQWSVVNSGTVFNGICSSNAWIYQQTILVTSCSSAVIVFWVDCFQNKTPPSEAGEVSVMTTMQMSMILVMCSATTELSVLIVSSMGEAEALNLVMDDKVKSDENQVPDDEGEEIPDPIPIGPADDEDLYADQLPDNEWFLFNDDTSTEHYGVENLIRESPGAPVIVLDHHIFTKTSWARRHSLSHATLDNTSRHS